jgi:GTP-binding protein
MHHRFEAWRELEGDVSGRANGVLVSMLPGKAVAFGLDGLRLRGPLLTRQGEALPRG